MPDKRFGKSEKPVGVKPLRDLIAAVAGPREWSDNRKSWLARAAHHAGITQRQAKALWYGEITDDSHRSARLMRDAAANHYEQLAQMLLNRDAEFHQHEIAAYLNLAGQLRRFDHVEKKGE